MPIPFQTIAFTSAILFVDWSKGANPSSVSKVRMDVRHQAMGGFNATPMTILDVVHIVDAGQARSSAHRSGGTHAHRDHLGHPR